VSAPRPRPVRRRRGGPLRVAAGVALLLLAFAIGIAFGQALEENPQPGGTQTSVRTLRPADLAEPPETVTVTVSSP
jgi:hypothetical protein